MRLAMFREGGKDRIGVVDADMIIDVTAGLPSLSPDLVDWLPGLRDCFIKAVRCAEECSSKSGSNRV
ncbi:hypothetical protein TQ36_08780 [Burkholderia cenocepacia]|nr:hypothetical protein TQ36_08780 [Burkholderia cenocepacia]